MMHQDELKSFYTKHNLIPGDDKSSINSMNDYLLFVFAALDKSRSFGYFARANVRAVCAFHFMIVFRTWEELFEAYYSLVCEV